MKVPQVPKPPKGWDINNYIGNVARGAAWLDIHFPGWERKINLETLNINLGDQCVCGQVVPREMVEAMDCYTGFGAVNQGLKDDNIMAHGFGSHTVHGDLWVSLIKERFDSGYLSDNAQ